MQSPDADHPTSRTKSVSRYYPLYLRFSRESDEDVIRCIETIGRHRAGFVRDLLRLLVRHGLLEGGPRNCLERLDNVVRATLPLPVLSRLVADAAHRKSALSGVNHELVSADVSASTRPPISPAIPISLPLENEDLLASFFSDSPSGI